MGHLALLFYNTSPRHIPMKIQHSIIAMCVYVCACVYVHVCVCVQRERLKQTCHLDTITITGYIECCHSDKFRCAVSEHFVPISVSWEMVVVIDLTVSSTFMLTMNCCVQTISMLRLRYHSMGFCDTKLPRSVLFPIFHHYQNTGLPIVQSKLSWFRPIPSFESKSVKLYL